MEVRLMVSLFLNGRLRMTAKLLTYVLLKSSWASYDRFAKPMPVLLYISSILSNLDSRIVSAMSSRFLNSSCLYQS